MKELLIGCLIGATIVMAIYNIGGASRSNSSSPTQQSESVSECPPQEQPLAVVELHGKSFAVDERTVMVQEFLKHDGSILKIVRYNCEVEEIP